MLSDCLVSIISLRLLPVKAGMGRAPAAEILVNTAAIREYILDRDKQSLITHAIAEGSKQYGSQTFDQSILRLYNDGLIDYDVAYQSATNPDDLDLKIRGIEGTSDRGWM